MYHLYLDSPIGLLLLTGDRDRITTLELPGRNPPKIPDDSSHDGSVLDYAASQLEEYFAGTRTTFELNLDPSGTPFQKRVWAAVSDVPYGATASYRDIAEAAESPRAVRAVGMANRNNPIALIVPCHRIIGADGSLTGYGGGLAMKRWLLDHEQGATAPTLFG